MSNISNLKTLFESFILKSVNFMFDDSAQNSNSLFAVFVSSLVRRCQPKVKFCYN